MTDKIGRNDACPCGSGKKYKQCCMAKKKLGLKGMNIKWLSKPQERAKTPPNLLERTFGQAIQEAKTSEYEQKKEKEE